MQKCDTQHINKMKNKNLVAIPVEETFYVTHLYGWELRAGNHTRYGKLATRYIDTESASQSRERRVDA